MPRMGLVGVLCRLSRKRLRLIEQDPDLVGDLMKARLEEEIPGLLDLGKTWQAIDIVLWDGDARGPLGDAVLGRSGRPIGPDLGFGEARVLPPDRVKEVAVALAALPDDRVRARYPGLRDRTVHGGYGSEIAAPDDPKYVKDAVRETQESEIDELERSLERLTELYRSAAQEGHAMLVAVV